MAGRKKAATRKLRGKYEKYRNAVGKPRGPGVKGNKSGKGSTRGTNR